MVNKLIAALEGEKWEDARWFVEAALQQRGVSKRRSKTHSTNTPLPLSAFDLPTLLDTLLETPTSTDPSGGSMWRSRLSVLVKSLRESSTSNSSTGPIPGLLAVGSRPRPKRLPSRRQYWPGDAKDVFWNLVRSLNKYDKEFSPQGRKSPIQLEIAEAVTRRWWEVEYGQEAS